MLCHAISDIAIFARVCRCERRCCYAIHTQRLSRFTPFSAVSDGSDAMLCLVFFHEPHAAAEFFLRRLRDEIRASFAPAASALIYSRFARADMHASARAFSRSAGGMRRLRECAQEGEVVQRFAYALLFFCWLSLVDIYLSIVAMPLPAGMLLFARYARLCCLLARKESRAIIFSSATLRSSSPMRHARIFSCAYLHGYLHASFFFPFFCALIYTR